MGKWDKLDKLFSELIRKRAMLRSGGCERCLTQKFDKPREDGTAMPAWMTLQCSHFIGRSTIKVRFDDDNAAGLCGGCHTYLEHHPHEHEEFAKMILGDRYDLLIGRSTTKQKIDIEAIYLYLKEKLKELNETNHL